MLQKRIESLLKLAKTLSFGNESFAAIARRAEFENPWFTADFIELSAKNIVKGYLEKGMLTDFGSTYKFPNEKKNVGIVMAGNIPMVGFHDLLCGVLSGHQLTIKLSSKDKTLMQFIIDELKNDNEELAQNIQTSEMLKGCDAYIATGSNQSNVYFDQYFGKYPNVLRKSRSSVAILTGNESVEDLKALGKDVHYYFGLGCRNVSKIYVPKGYNFVPLITAFKEFEHLENMHKYKNNIDYNLSLLLLNQQMYMSTKALLVVEHKNTHAPISVLHYETYENIKEVEAATKENKEVQAIVGKGFIPFGVAQCPVLNEFADGIDTMKFLSEL